MENKGKTPLLSPGRSAGDGMENTMCGNEQPLNGRHSTGYLTRPFAHLKTREPKFVPYEPYKAAISPMVPQRMEKLTSSKQVIDSQKVSSLASSIIQMQESHLKPKVSLVTNSLDSETKKCISCEDNESKVKFLEEKISNMENEKKELVEEFKVQTQVTADLKKLLVASLGEDVQTYAGQLVEQKAQLGSQVMQLHSQLRVAQDQADSLQLQSDLWQTKFMASSVLVEEVSHWKSALCKRLAALSSLLREHETLFQQLSSSHGILLNILSAFERETVPPKMIPAVSVLELAAEVKQTAKCIQERLLGPNFCAKYSENGTVYPRQPTQAESQANEIIGSLQHSGRVSSGNSKCDSGRVACHLLPHHCDNETTIHCCKHCSGEIKTV